MKYALVTGADRGLGLALVRVLLKKGYRVFAGRYLGECAELDRLRTTAGDRLDILPLDVGSDESVRDAAQAVEAETDRLDLLVNNAAVLGDIDATVEDALDFADMLRVYNVNALGALRVTNALFPLLKRGEDKLIVNISSEAGSIAACWRTAWFGYAMSKAALNRQSAIVHNHFRKFGGQVLVVHPGWIRTHMRGRLDEAAELSPDEAAELVGRLIDNHRAYAGDRPAFLNERGEPMPW
ncbi:MAG: hypothetical protein BLM47_05410 [Candidatus Reconcilbacillus cellulovorans]|uniref:Short-chain dehydrogenase n=1 Tax=Candidatus Reconcilbacillus cellulovorans TaxID=1906605 RepID=A0A2A6E156_9BACL|nr:MAG: hypothetical protein BLM47_05410 [Candidatus Reconcilbacillus cellulovorans]